MKSEKLESTRQYGLNELQYIIPTEQKQQHLFKNGLVLLLGLLGKIRYNNDHVLSVRNVQDIKYTHYRADP